MGIKNQLKLENKKEIIIEKINNDISLTQIAKDLNSSVTAVKAVVTKYLPNKKFTSSKPKLYNLKEEVYLDYLKTPNLKKLASEVNLSEGYISAAFKKEMGMSIMKYAKKIRIDRAKVLLVTTNTSILEISITLGFHDQSHFHKVFKSFTGVSPSEYRNTNFG